MRTCMLIVLYGIASYATGATYYVAPGGSDRNSCGSAQSRSSPKASFSSVWGCLSAGDTLIVQDGVYNQDLTPPAGKSGQPDAVIAIQAANDGAARINGRTILRANAYLSFAGLRLEGPGADNAVVSIGSRGAGQVSHHITFRRTGFHCPLTGPALNDSACVDMGDGAHHNLLEDSWIWGGGRYSLVCYGGSGGNLPNTGCDDNTFRRVLIRMGPNQSSDGNPQACLSLYYASRNLVENTICLDSVPASNSSNAGFYVTQHATPPNSDGNRFLGDIVLNVKGNAENQGVGFYLDVDHNGNSNNTVIQDLLVWDVGAEGISLYNSSPVTHCTGTILQNVTVGAIEHGDGYWNACQGTTISNSLLLASRGYGLNQYGSAGSTLGAYNLFFGNLPGPLNNLSLGNTDLTADPQIRYLTRIEPDSPGFGSGHNGVNRGADLTRRYVDGVKTGASLWPWPHETRIQKEMCAESGISTGFCAASSLTYYVWNYLDPDKQSHGSLNLLPALMEGTVAADYYQELAASGGAGDYRYRLADGSLPAGLSLSVDGLISGTPLTAGLSSFTISVSDLAGNVGTGSYVLKIGDSNALGVQHRR